jgi:hypothetical protein
MQQTLRRQTGHPTKLADDLLRGGLFPGFLSPFSMSYTFMVTVFLVNKRDGYIRPYELTEPQSKSTSCHYQMFIQKKKISPQGAQSRLGGVVVPEAMLYASA